MNPGKSAMINQVINAVIPQPINDELRSSILSHFASASRRTPSHPPYSLMIHTAITALNEKGGSSAAGISDYITREYKDLPLGHSSFLNHHLKKCCLEKLIVYTKRGRYKLFDATTSDIQEKNQMQQTERIEEWNEKSQELIKSPKRQKNGLPYDQSKSTQRLEKGFGVKFHSVGCTETALQETSGVEFHSAGCIKKAPQETSGVEFHSVGCIQKAPQETSRCREVSYTARLGKEQKQKQIRREIPTRRIKSKFGACRLCECGDGGQNSISPHGKRIPIRTRKEDSFIEMIEKESFEGVGQWKRKKVVCGLAAHGERKRLCGSQPKLSEKQAIPLSLESKWLEGKLEMDRKMICLSKPTSPIKSQEIISKELVQQQPKPLQVYVRRKWHKSNQNN